MRDKARTAVRIGTDIIDAYELGIIVSSVIFYYTLRIFTGTTAAAFVAFLFGAAGLAIYLRHPRLRSFRGRNGRESPPMKEDVR
jgi:hypothetical protein